jgi:Fic family protein
MNTTGKSFIEIEDLKKAYKFAKENPLSLASFLEAHKYISETIISESQYRGVIRDKNVGVFGDGKKVYSGASKDIVEAEMTKLFADIKVLLDANLTVSETFYYASMLHLVFVKIHPFADGNGRSARLLEKWFLASKMGENAWFIQSEKLYQTRVKSYYKNVSLGQSYDVVDYDFCLPFLLMLPMALRIK